MKFILTLAILLTIILQIFTSASLRRNKSRRRDGSSHNSSCKKQIIGTSCGDGMKCDTQKRDFSYINHTDKSIGTCKYLEGQKCNRDFDCFHDVKCHHSTKKCKSGW